MTVTPTNRMMQMLMMTLRRRRQRRQRAAQRWRETTGRPRAIGDAHVWPPSTWSQRLEAADELLLTMMILLFLMKLKMMKRRRMQPLMSWKLLLLQK